MTRKIIVTGARGFLGTHLCALLEAQGNTVIQLNSENCDLTLLHSLERFNQDVFDHIYHLAAWTQAGDFCLSHPGEQWIINQQINTNVLSWWQRSQPQATLICIGTSCAYDPQLELEEDNYLIGTPIESLFTYAMTKRMLYAGVIALHRQFGLKYLHLVPSTLYGPHYHTDGRQMHFIFDLIAKILRGKLYGEAVVLWGDGHQRRELVYVDDFAKLAAELPNRSAADTINIGAGEEFTIRHFAQLICDKVDYDFDDIRFDTTRYVGARSKCLVVKRLRQIVPDLHLTSLDAGIQNTIDWFMTHRERLVPEPHSNP